MQRREFNQGAVSAAVISWLGLSSCGGGGGGGTPQPVGADAPPIGAAPPATPGPPTGAPAPQPAQPEVIAPRNLIAMGTNFSGMEWALSGLRSSARTRPNIDFTVPRVPLVRELALNHFGRNRLPIQWELLQPMLSDTQANAQARALIGEPGAFDERYARFIDRIFDAHAAMGARCILDLHNYGRYKDFRFQPDGSVQGLRAPEAPSLQAWTTDASQVWTRIFATAPGASLRPAAFADFWTHAARRWKDHPGFGGYGIMNEPFHMPRPGQVVETPDGTGEDLMIWPAFARVAIDAIRAIDAAGPIYLAGNAWGGAMNIGPEYNPAWPLAGTNIVYDVHSYVDAFNNGNGFDWELEVAKGFTAGEGNVPMSLDTGLRRMRIATDWARQHGVRLALTETGMPVDDPRFHEAFRRMIAHTWSFGAEVQSWMGGSHWAVRSHGINHVPNWHQDRTQEPLVAGVMKAVAGIDQAVLFDDGPGWDASGTVTVTVYARGSLAAPLTLRVHSDSGGSFSKSTLVIPAGANGEDSFRFTPEPDRVTTLRYEGTAPQLPRPRKVVSLLDPVARAAANLDDAALALLARYDACKWDLADGHTDFLQGRPARDGDAVRAIGDSGFGSRVGNPMEMLNWMNQDGPDMGPWRPAVMREVEGRRGSDHADPDASGFWCKKVLPSATYPAPRNVIPYGLADPHFIVAAVSVPAGVRDGVVFQASTSGGTWYARLAFAGGRPQAQWRDARGQVVTLTAAESKLGPMVLSARHAPGDQQLRVDSVQQGSGSARLEPAPFDSLLIGWSFLALEPGPGFGGRVHGVVTGRGSPSDAELQVLERFLGTRAGLPR